MLGTVCPSADAEMESAPSRRFDNRDGRCDRERAEAPSGSSHCVAAGGAVAIATGTVQAAVYWGNYGSNGTGTTIGRASLTGSKPNQRFITKAAGPVGIAVDRKYLYWADTLNSSCGGTTIGRAKIDGSAPNPSFIKGVSCAHGIAVNGSFIYWANRGPNGTGTSIGRANLNGSGGQRQLHHGRDGAMGSRDRPWPHLLDEPGDGRQERPVAARSDGPTSTAQMSTRTSSPPALTALPASP